MASNSPTIVIGQLNDKELQESINKLVTNLDTALETMKQNTKAAVTDMQNTLKSLGDIKVDFGGSADGGSSRRAKSQKTKTEAIKQATQAKKEYIGTLDQLAAAEQKAARSASVFIQNERENLRMRQNEIQARIDNLRKQFGNVEIKTIVRDDGTFSRAVDKAKQKIEEIRRQLQNVPPTSALGKQFSQELQTARNEYNELIRSRKAFEAKSQITSLASEYEQNNKKIRELATAYKQLYTDEKQAENAMNNGAVAIARYGDSAEKAQQKLLKASFSRAINILPQGDDLAYAKLERLRSILADHRFLGALSPSEIKRARAEVQKLESQLVDYISKINSSTQAQHSSANATNQSKKTLDELNAYIQKNIQREQERRDAIRQTGLAARETANQLIRSAHEQTLALGNSPITGIKELTVAVEQMRQAYFDMSASEKTSPVGMALEADIKRANDAIAVIKKYNQSLSGAEQGNGNNITNASTLSGLRESLKNLTDQYNKLTVAELNAGKGDALIQHFQDTTRAAQILQRTLNRPVSLKAALAGDERTLDDIAYKMQRLRAYKQGIDLTKPNAANEIKQVGEALARLQKDADKWMSKSQEMIKNNTALGRSWNYMKNRLAFYFTVGASTQFIKNLIEVRSQYEMNERALGILINSAERGSQIFKELSDMALVSPYTLIELSAAAKQLTAYDIAAKDVVDTTRRLADLTAAVGIPIERLTYAIGQVKAYGYLNARDARMFSNAGIPLVKELADYYTKLEGHIVSTADVYDKIKKKAIGYNDVMSVVTKMTDEGGKFFDFQAKMAGTLKVQLANLTLAWNNMLNEIGSSRQSVLSGFIGGMKELFLQWRNIENIINSVLVAFGLWKTAQITALAFTGKLTGAIATQVLVGEKLQTKLASLAAGTKTASIGISAAGAAFWLVLADAVMTYKRNAEEIETLNKNIADGAKESAESIKNFLESTEIYQNRLNAATGKLPKSEAEKTWESLREKIELTADSSEEIIANLLDPKKYDNINDRLVAGFNILDSIRKVTENIGDSFDNLDVSQDTMLFGAFGEGLAEDIEDYNDRIKYTTDVAEWASKKNKDFWDNAIMGLKALFNSVKEDLGSSEEEAQEEIKKFASTAAETIKDELGEEGLKDKIQINEAISRVIQGMEKQFPQIRGKGKALFETIFYDVMAAEFEGAVDKQAHYYSLFLKRLKKDHASAFQDVTDGILDDTHTWNKAQLEAIKKTADRVKEDLPAASQDAINKILNQLNNTDFKLRIVTEFAKTTQDEVARQFRERFILASSVLPLDEKEKKETENLQKYGSLMKKTEESNLEYQDRVRKKREENIKISEDASKIIAANKNKVDEASRAIIANAEQEKKAADDFLASAKEVEDWGGYDFSTKKENADVKKQQKQAESELQKALKEEIQLIDKVRSTYKSLYDTGISTDEALAEATEDLEEPIRNINKVLNKYGLKLDISKFVGVTNPHALTRMIQEQIDALMGKAKPAEIQSLKLKVKEYEIDAKKFDQQTFTDSLNKSLNNLKDEYELAVSLDADPELGYAFADAMGINLDTLPRTAQEYADRYTKILNEYLKNKNAGIELPHLNLTDDDLAVYEKMVKEEELNKKVYDEIVKAVNTVRSIRKKEMEEHMKSFDKLIEKYSEYEHKVMNIQNNSASAHKELVKRFGNEEQVSEAVRLSTEIGAAKDPEERQRLIEQLSNLAKEVSKENPTAAKINVAITNEEEQGVAKAGFEDFQKSPEWILATGELAGMTRKAIGGLIKSLEQYKKSAKNLDPKQVKQINNALKSLYREQRNNNPFYALSDAISRAKDRASAYDEAIEKADNDIREFYKNRKDGEELTEKEKEELQKLQDAWQQLKDAQADAGSIDATEVVGSLNTMVSGIKGITGAFTDLFKAISGKDSDLNKVFSILDKAGSTAAMGAAIGGGWGAAVGAVIGGITGVISEFGENISGNSGLSRDINASARYVRELEFAYVDLEEAINKAYGSNVVGAKRAMAANKELQLAELERQLQLEQERSSKYRDEERIYNLQKQIKELRYEIVNSTREIVDDLLGTDVAGFAENLVSTMITAFKNGEDYMKEFGKSFDTMVDNMIMKSIVARVTGQYIEQIWTGLENKIKSRTAKEADDYARAQSIQNEYKDLTDTMLLRRYMLTNPDEKNLPAALLSSDEQLEELYLSQQKYRDIVDNMRANVDAAAKNAEDTLNSAQMINNSDINELLNQLAVIKPELGERLKELIGEWYTFGEDSDTQLSALQQGIQGITEDTAGAIEAYLNIVSQKMFEQNAVMIEIRDAINGFSFDEQLGTMSLILLQLQQSYQMQSAIYSILSGWSNANGMAVRVEMV